MTQLARSTYGGSPVVGREDAPALRVAFLVTYFPKMSEVFLLNQALELEALGHEVTFYALADPGEGRRQEGTDRFLSGRAHSGRMPRRLGARTRRLPRLLARHGARPVLEGLNVLRYGVEASTLRTLFRLDSVPRDGIACDVAHAQFGGVARQCLLLRRLGILTVPLVTSFRGDDLSAYVRRARSGVYAPVFAASAACLPVSGRWVATLRSMGCPESRIHVLPSGVPMNRIPRKARDAQHRPRRLVSAARLERYKGIHLGLEAIRLVVDELPDVVWEVFGDGPELAALRERCRQLDLERNVMWHGFVPHSELLSSLSAFDAHLFTTVTSLRGRTEGVPNILKETQAAGIPALAFDHPGVDEVVEDETTGWLVPEGDVAALARRTVALLRQPARVATMGRVAAERSRSRFDLTLLTRRLVSIYRSAIEDEDADRAAGQPSRERVACPDRGPPC